MLRSHYQVTLFTHRGRPLFTLGLGGASLFLLLAVMLLLSAAAGYQAVRYEQIQVLLQRQDDLLEERRELSRKTLQQSAALRRMESRVAGIVDFNSKLRIMLNIASPDEARYVLAPEQRPGRKEQRLPALTGRNHLRDMRRRLDAVSGTMLQEEARQQHIALAVGRQLENLGTIPVIMPTRGRFSSPFGWRTDPFTGGRRFHKGIDLTARTGTPVRTTANGVVTQVARSASYGLVIVVTHNNTLRTRYAHLSKFAVTEGQRVLRGQIIGYVGNTGRSKAPHLHYEVHQNNKPVNPRNYILQ
jgi:murein DD-endopeptidase MepM/ murein hydrolase activator NlpD